MATEFEPTLEFERLLIDSAPDPVGLTLSILVLSTFDELHTFDADVVVSSMIAVGSPSEMLAVVVPFLSVIVIVAVDPDLETAALGE